MPQPKSPPLLGWYLGNILEKENSIKGKEKATWKMMQKRRKRGQRGRNMGKRLGEYFSGCSVIVCYYIYSNISYITNLDVDVGKLPNHLKSGVLYFFSLDQFLVYFIILQSPTDWESTCCEVWCGSIITWKNTTFSYIYIYLMYIFER